jgi:hypothetical protein
MLRRERMTIVIVIMTYVIAIDPRIARLGPHAGRLQAGG